MTNFEPVDQKQLGLMSNIRITANEESDRMQGAIDAFNADDLSALRQYHLLEDIWPCEGLEGVRVYWLAISLRDPFNPTVIMRTRVRHSGEYPMDYSNPWADRDYAYTARVIHVSELVKLHLSKTARTVFEDFFKRAL